MFNILLLLALLSLLEGLLFLLVHSPDILKQCPQQIGNMIGYIYARERPIIKFEPACARYDPTIGYTLKPGSCNFGGREFMNRYDINSLGTRDDEASLQHPEIIVAGDSFAMGWGVNQEETFVKQLEKKIGIKVLNAAVASYGTAREMMILRRLPTDRMKYLIIQYCGNDIDENREFYLNNNRLPIMSSQQYKEYQNLYKDSLQYFFGKYLWTKIKKRWEESGKRREQLEVVTDRDEIDLFLNAVQNNGLDLDKVTIITFVMNGRNPADNKDFPAGLKKKLTAGNYPPYLKNMIVLDFSDQLQKEHFYVLDDHLNAGGHMIIANTLAKTIKAGRTQ
jgi:hypothetical protein